MTATEHSDSLPGYLLYRQQDRIGTSHLTEPGHRFKRCMDKGKLLQKTYMTIIHAPSSMQTLAFALLDLKGQVTHMAKESFYIRYDLAMQVV